MPIHIGAHEHAMPTHIGARTSGALGKWYFVSTGTRASRIPVGEVVEPVSTLAGSPTGIPVAPRTGLLESLRVRKAGEGPESIPCVARDREPHVPSSNRRGKAPPVDSFNGESQEVLFEDWLPSLHRVAEWNGWSSSETLIQLAGHLRGRALQEWGLLSAGEKSSLDEAITAMHSRLELSSRASVGQHFRHASQRDSEPVSDFIRRLEQLFKLAYGRDLMGDETRKMLLHCQLQEGLRDDIMEAPAVSGSRGYQQHCLAARNEEKRLAELAKRRRYHKTSVTSNLPQSGRPDGQFPRQTTNPAGRFRNQPPKQSED